MLFRAVSSLAIAALAGQAIAEPVAKPYKLKLAKMSVKDIFGLERRDDSGYQPTQTFCGTGTTCAEACGAGFEQCASKDNSIHCFDPSHKQTCCPGQTGDSCDDGYYCSADNKGATWCCPNGMSLEDCAKQYSVTGGLSSEMPVVTPTSSATPSPASPTLDLPLTSSILVSSSSIVSALPTTSIVPAVFTNSSGADCTTYTTDIVHTILPTTPSVSANITGLPPTTTVPTATAIVTAAASNQGPMGMLALGAAALVALF